MLKNKATYPIRTYLLFIYLCITFLSFSQNENDSLQTLVSDSAKIVKFCQENEEEQLERIKIPLWKKDNEKRIWLLPALAWNNYDKTQIGAFLGFQKKEVFTVLLNPMYGTGSKNFTGNVLASLKVPVAKNHFLVTIQAKRFSYLLFPEDLAYQSFHAKMAYHFKNAKQHQFSAYFKSQYVWQEYLLSIRKTSFFQIQKIGLTHQFENKKLTVNQEGSVSFGKEFALFQWESQLKLPYKKQKGNAFYVQAFAGSFLYQNKASNQIEAPLPIFQLSGASNTGIHWLQKDYAFQDFYLDRNAQDPFLRRQVADSEGGFKSFTNIGNSNQFLFALNLKSDVMLPSKIKKYVNLQPFANLAYSKSKNIKGNIYAESGLSIGLFKEYIALHVPFVSTQNIKDNQASIFGINKGSWTKRVTFSLQIHKFLAHLSKQNTN